ncbi:MAG TPA: DUF2269 family protein [Candidatus Limnocylindria bacterium]|nr:DUF2269 family protein [Candidatus Limnocylindria bacterium]
MDLYPWVVFLHVLGAFGFVMAHGASAFVSISMRRQASPERVAAMLNVSMLSIGMMYTSLLLLIVAGVIAGFMGSWWGQGWIWAAIGLLVLMLIFMYSMATNYYVQVRDAAGVPSGRGPKDAGPPVASPERLSELLDSTRPFTLAGVGGIGLLLIIWLMVVKPF